MGNITKFNPKSEHMESYIDDVRHYKYYLYLLVYLKGNYENDIIMMTD